MVTEDIYAALAAIAGVDVVYDTKRPDGYDLTGAVLVFSAVSDAPVVPIDGGILGYEQRWQVSVYVKDRAYADTPALHYARALKASVIAALHGLNGASARYVEFDNAAGEFYDADGVEYHLPIDFLVHI